MGHVPLVVVINKSKVWSMVGNFNGDFHGICSHVSVSRSMQWNLEEKICNQMKIDELEDVTDEWTVMRTVWNISYG